MVRNLPMFVRYAIMPFLVLEVENGLVGVS